MLEERLSKIIEKNPSDIINYNRINHLKKYCLLRLRN